MLKSYKYRIYPNADQRGKIDATLNACRLVYNLALEIKIKAYKDHGINLSAYTIGKDIKDLRAAYPWIAAANAGSLHEKLNDVSAAFGKFFKGAGYPKFKKKTEAQSYTCKTSIKINEESGRLSIAKIKDIKIKLSRVFSGDIRRVTIKRTCTGKYFCSILVKSIDTTPEPHQEGAVGIDLGISHFAVLSDGRKFNNPKRLLSSVKRLKVLQKRLSKKKKGSKNRLKAKLQVALLHERVVNQRCDFLHKASSQIAYDNQIGTICVESLRIKNMVKNHKLAFSISDASWGEFVRQIEYKTQRAGKQLIKIGSFEPSTKMCNSCGSINENLTLKDRDWTCVCGVNHDRDINAAINIRNIGLKTGQGVPGEPVELPSIDGAVKQEEANSLMPRHSRG